MYRRFTVLGVSSLALTILLAPQGALGAALRQGAVDPTIVFSTFLGGSQIERYAAVALDFQGNIVVAGTTSSPDFPTVRPISGYHAGVPKSTDLFLAKLAPDGSRLLFSTYLGGSGSDTLLDLALDAEGNAYLVGSTDSPDFPAGKGYQSTLRGPTDAYALKVAASGDTVLFGTYLGGNRYDTANSVAVKPSGEVVVAGSTNSADFPTERAIQGRYRDGSTQTTDGFVATLSPAGDHLQFGTYLGGSGKDDANDVALTAKGAIVVVGNTISSDFPVANGLKRQYPVNGDAFVCQLDDSAPAISYCSLVGGSVDEVAYGVTLATDGGVFIVGRTNSPDYPSTWDLPSGLGGGSYDVFITELSAAGTAILYSSFFGGHDVDSVGQIAVDVNRRVYVNGSTRSKDFPIAPAGGRGLRGFSDAFVAQLDPATGQLRFSKLLGGSDGEENGAGPRNGALVVTGPDQVLVTGYTTSKDFPVRNALQGQLLGGSDSFITSLDLRGRTVPAPTPVPSPTPVMGATCEQILRRVPQAIIANALANPTTIGGWNQLCNPNLPPGPTNGRRNWLSLRSLGVPYDSQFNPVVYKCGCP